MGFFLLKTLRCSALVFVMDSMRNKICRGRMWLFGVLLNLTGKCCCCDNWGSGVGGEKWLDGQKGRKQDRAVMLSRSEASRRPPSETLRSAQGDNEPHPHPRATMKAHPTSTQPPSPLRNPGLDRFSSHMLYSNKRVCDLMYGDRVDGYK